MNWKPQAEHPPAAEAHLWDRLRQCQYNNEAAAARIHELETALREIAEESFVTDTAYDAIRIARAALMPSVARTPSEGS